MPNMDGYKATEIIRKMSDKEKAEIPIIAMTANAFEEDRRKAISIGMNEHITKPIDAEKMKKTITRSVEAERMGTGLVAFFAKRKKPLTPSPLVLSSARKM